MLNQLKINITPKQIREIEQKLMEIKKEKYYTYPWNGIKDEFQSKNLDKIVFIGYGSILNSESAVQTFPNLPHNSFKPVLAFGVRRIFNYEMPFKIDRYEPPDNPINRAALNTIHTGRINDIVNGILVRLPLNYIPHFRSREVGYDLVPVIYVDWFKKNGPLKIAYILSCPDEIRKGHNRINNNILPHKNYYNVCKEGANEYGESFLQYWLSTTYLADGFTQVKDWESVL